MKQQISFTQMLYLIAAFCLILIGGRVLVTGKLTFVFILWNIFLAFIPYWLSKKLYLQKGITKKSVSLLVAWLLFFPNAPYIITDLFHLQEREPIPKWYDLIILVTAGWNGLLIAVASLLEVEGFLLKKYTSRKANITIVACLVLTGYGIYIGRYLRYNSWDILTNTDNLLRTIIQQLMNPIKHKFIWIFSLLFATVLGIFYYSLKLFVTTKHINNQDKNSFTAKV